jgi:TatD DNase family protein
VTEALLDTHCHVDAYNDPVAVLDEARNAGIEVVAVTEDPGRFRLLRTRLGRRSGVYTGIGLHPLRVTHHAHAELQRLLRLLPDADWVGEVGLDFSRAGAATRHQQLRAFDALLAQDAVLRRPITVHSRAAERETVQRLVQARAIAVLHWYTGPLSVAEEAIAGGLWFSVNPAMVASKRTATLLKLLPPDRVVLETDGPFARHRGRAARPPDTVSIVEHLARVWGLANPATRAQIIDNQTRLLGAARSGSRDHHNSECQP